MRFTVVTTGRFRLDRAFGFGLAASSQTQLSVVNSLTRPAGLAPAWQPASPAHTRTPKLSLAFAVAQVSNLLYRRIVSLSLIHISEPTRPY